MNYRRHYELLIKTRYNRKLVDGVYYEKHHIIPKCWGGSDVDENIIHLTGREHYIAHWLLYRMRPHSNGTSFAFWKMTFPGGKFLEGRDYIISSRAYEEAKSAMAEANRRLNTGRKVKKEHLKKWKKNKNNSKEVINIKTGETRTNAKQLWREKFKGDISYSAFNYYLRGKIKGKNAQNRGPRKLYNEEIYNWEYNV